LGSRDRRCLFFAFIVVGYQAALPPDVVDGERMTST